MTTEVSFSSGVGNCYQVLVRSMFYLTQHYQVNEAPPNVVLYHSSKSDTLTISYVNIEVHPDSAVYGDTRSQLCLPHTALSPGCLLNFSFCLRGLCICDITFANPHKDSGTSSGNVGRQRTRPTWSSAERLLWTMAKKWGQSFSSCLCGTFMTQEGTKLNVFTAMPDWPALIFTQFWPKTIQSTPLFSFVLVS